ncbi:hypothetical protein B9Z65_4008 [Elsinoe australis]|uniref:Uncharacterized protein n=1 Tax=Elsinoe australis TaxID=40998 RepID=A0A2P7Z1K5_9PEZI|nr:hypothetical protein B9Z65_4008 [Elsinoe australis]
MTFFDFEHVLLFLLFVIEAGSSSIPSANRSLYVQGDDLFSFVTRPDIRAPRWRVTKHHPDLIAPGYWLIGAYTEMGLLGERLEYIPQQVGPHIYDGSGELVWSGAPLFNNRIATDFRVVDINGENHLAWILFPRPWPGDIYPEGTVVILDASLTPRADLINASRVVNNTHEFLISDDSNQLLHFVNVNGEGDISDRDWSGTGRGNLCHDCIVQSNLRTGEREFRWCPLEHGISLNESYMKTPAMLDSPDMCYDYMHANSIDIFDNGDLLISSRHMNTIFCIDHLDGSVKWRLGGTRSTFTMNFNFSSQHHARIYDQNETTIVLTFLDNASDWEGLMESTAVTSSAKRVALDLPSKSAQLLQTWYRPDGGLTGKRGSADVLTNDNLLLSWSERGYMSEHTVTGEVVFEAEFLTQQMCTYRAYKSNFVSNPAEPPIAKSIALQVQGIVKKQVTAMYVSWNGATEVKSWNFYGSSSIEGTYVLVGSSEKTGFETKYVHEKAWAYIYVEAVSADGSALRRTVTVQTKGLEFDEHSAVEEPGEDMLHFVAHMPFTGGTVSMRSSAAIGTYQMDKYVTASAPV